MQLLFDSQAYLVPSNCQSSSECVPGPLTFSLHLCMLLLLSLCWFFSAAVRYTLSVPRRKKCVCKNRKFATAFDAILMLTFRTTDNRQLNVSVSLNDSSHTLCCLRKIRNANLRANRLTLTSPAKLIFDRKFSTVNWSVSKSKFNKYEFGMFYYFLLVSILTLISNFFPLDITLSLSTVSDWPAS